VDTHCSRYVLSGLRQDNILGTSLCILSPPHKGVLVLLPVSRGEDLCLRKDGGDFGEAHSVRCMQRRVD
jgi:hypothetical protein